MSTRFRHAALVGKFNSGGIREELGSIAKFLVGRGLAVSIEAAVFLEVNKPKPVVLFEVAKGWLTGEKVEAGETHRLSEPHRS